MMVEMVEGIRMNLEGDGEFFYFHCPFLSSVCMEESWDTEVGERMGGGRWGMLGWDDDIVILIFLLFPYQI